MSERIRIPNCDIPFNYRERFPVWINCLDEEGVEGQDEATHRPSESGVIDWRASIATAWVTGANGMSYPATLMFGAESKPYVILIYPDQTLEGRHVEISHDEDGGPYWSEYAEKPGWYHNWVSIDSIAGLLPFRLTTVAVREADNRPVQFVVNEVEKGLRAHRRRETEE